MSITSKPFGTTKLGQMVTAWTLKNSAGLSAVILNFGGVLLEMNTPDRDGRFANISCFYPDISSYEDLRPFFGSLVGRYANRIAKGKFVIDGIEYDVPINNGENALHGGLRGFDQVIYDVKPLEDENGIRLTYTSPDGEEGYPGTLDLTVDYVLSNANELIIRYHAVTDKPTVLNLTNHTFWNLNGALGGNILPTELTLYASRYLAADTGLIPTGQYVDIAGTPLDFRRSKPIGRDIAGITESQFNGGYDHCYVLDKVAPGELSLCAEAYDPRSGRTMAVSTTEPGAQLYTANFVDGTTGVGDYKYQKHCAFCIEAQHYPDSPNHPEFPTTLLRPGEVYQQVTSHQFGTR